MTEELRLDHRKHERVTLIAEIECKVGDEIAMLVVQNASLGGLFLEGAPDEHPPLKVGVTVDISVAVQDEPESEAIALQAKIVRVERRGAPFVAGFGVAITAIDEQNRRRLKELLERRKR